MSDSALTLEQAMKRLNVSRPTILKLLNKSQEIPYYKIGTEYRIEPEDLQNFIQRGIEKTAERY